MTDSCIADVYMVSQKKLLCCVNKFYYAFFEYRLLNNLCLLYFSVV